MLFGMGMKLSKDEEARATKIVGPCYAALGLANDYFSFDIEYDDFTNSNQKTMTNSVWHNMQWYSVDVDDAKLLVKEQTIKYELEFHILRKGFACKYPTFYNLHHYLTALSYQVIGNIVWSLECPRYHPNNRYDPNTGLEFAFNVKSNGTSTVDDIQAMISNLKSSSLKNISMDVYRYSGSGNISPKSPKTASSNDGSSSDAPEVDCELSSSSLDVSSEANSLHKRLSRSSLGTDVSSQQLTLFSWPY